MTTITQYPQKYIGQKIGGGRHRVDIVVQKPDGHTCLVSLKWQQISGTAQEKVPFEVIKLIDAIQQSKGEYQHAYLVLGGDGWSPELKSFYVGGGLNKFIKDHNLVSIHTLDGFIALVNQRKLCKGSL